MQPLESVRLITADVDAERRQGCRVLSRGSRSRREGHRRVQRLHRRPLGPGVPQCWRRISRHADL